MRGIIPFIITFWAVLPFQTQSVFYEHQQCRSKGNISGGARERRRREPLRGSGDMLPMQKILKSRGLEILFPAFSKSYLWFTHYYLLRTLSQQTNAHWEYNTFNVNYKMENGLSLYLETSKCFGCLILLCITLRMLKNEKKYKCYCFKPVER